MTIAVAVWPKNLLTVRKYASGKVRMVKPDDRDAQRLAGCQRFPGDLVGVAGFDDVGPFLFEHALDGREVDERPVARGPRDRAAN